MKSCELNSQQLRIMENYYCVIMAGGIGSRFWPWSRKENPKQFLDILGTGESLIQQTFKRFEGIIPASNFYVVTNVDYKNTVLEQLPLLNENQVLCEPEMRNTAPCIAYASYKINKINPNAKIVVTPSDHLITDTMGFQNSITKGLEFVENKHILTLGIKPTRPDTGYGYIEYSNKQEESESIFGVSAFKEKPDEETAKSYLQTGNYLWNAGIFIWSTQLIVQEFENHLPAIANIFEKGLPHFNTTSETEYINSNFGKCENISIDYGIMERSENISTMPCEFGWSDLGTWGSLFENLQKDENNNASIGDNFFLNETTNSIVKTNKNKQVVIQGLDNLIVVDTDDVILICNKDHEQKIKPLLKMISK